MKSGGDKHVRDRSIGEKENRGATRVWGWCGVWPSLKNPRSGNPNSDIQCKEREEQTR